MCNPHPTSAGFSTETELEDRFSVADIDSRPSICDEQRAVPLIEFNASLALRILLR